ncbi:MAG: DUF5522 domain-containing protein [Steroidobacteraceae bacterium]
MKTTPGNRLEPGPASAPAQPLSLQDGDFYLEGGRMVCTAANHLRRGYCCGSQCRHCPYQQ